MSENFSHPKTGGELGKNASSLHVRFITLSQSGGSMEQFVTTFNDFCKSEKVNVEDVRLHEEYDENYEYIDDTDGDRPYMDIIHDVVAEVWFSVTVEGEASKHARLFVSEDYRDELDFYKAINKFCEKVDMLETVRAGSPYNRSLVAIYRGSIKEDFIF